MAFGLNCDQVTFRRLLRFWQVYTTDKICWQWGCWRRSWEIAAYGDLVTLFSKGLLDCIINIRHFTNHLRQIREITRAQGPFQLPQSLPLCNRKAKSVKFNLVLYKTFHLDKEIVYQLFHRISLAKTWYITEAKGWSKGKRSLTHILTKQRNEFIKLDQTLVALIEANLTGIEIYQDRDLLIKGRFTNYVNSRASKASRGRSL